MKKIFLALAVTVFMLLSACGGSQTKDNKQASESASMPTTEVLESVTIELEGHDNMKYTGDTKVKVKAGQKIILTLNNVGQLPKEAMGHNVVVLTLGTDVANFGTEAIKAKDDDYIPANLASSIIAHTKLLGPGETDSITFRLDTPGVYDYICTFPGHWATMRGTITVQ
ncbi:azurin [Saccharicrinis carchari]|uniref:Azurin n=1 Tax=Saccharicrinis carchari TaxID=1168039 RepID=A0A521BD22_SACCC|nr:azurin [Saccharicrinis carchari]SMO44986.1 azurin [Saccharicrinis carchari]